MSIEQPLRVRVAKPITVLAIVAVLSGLVWTLVELLGQGLDSLLIMGTLIVYASIRHPVYGFGDKPYRSIGELMRDATEVLTTMCLVATYGLGISTALGVGFLGRPTGIGLIVLAAVTTVCVRLVNRRRQSDTNNESG